MTPDAGSDIGGAGSAGALRTLSSWQVMLKFARLSGGFWGARQRFLAWFWTLGLAGAVILGVVANVLVNRWNGWFFDALESKDVQGAGIAIAVFPFIVLFAAGIGVLTLVTRETLQVHWRRWLTTGLVDLWIAHKRFFRLPQAGLEPANPEYRIADDVRWATEPVVDFAIGLLSAVITLVLFIGILWSIGGNLRVETGAMPLVIPAYLVLAAMGYAAIASCLILFFGQALPGRVAQRNEAEARLRFGLMRLRDNGETIAVSRGEPAEKQALTGIYDGLVQRWLAMIARRGRLTWITNSNAVLVPVVPLLLAAPKYLAGEMSLGGLVQVAAAFVQVQIAFNWVIENFMRIAEWMASARRVTDLVEAIEWLDGTSDIRGGEGPAQVAAQIPAHGAMPISAALAVRPANTNAGLRLVGLTLTQAQGRVILADLDLVVPAGASLHLHGELAEARAALILALTGLWPWGVPVAPAGQHVAVVPARLHLSQSSLRAILLPTAGPAAGSPAADVELAAALARYGLGELTAMLDERRDWGSVLSAGQRQRLAVARADLERPDIVIFDEATSELDDPAGAAVLRAFHAANPRTVILLLGHGAGFDSLKPRRVLARRIQGIVRFEAEESPGSLIRGTTTRGV